MAKATTQKLIYEDAKLDYIRVCEMVEKSEVRIDAMREDMRIALVEHETLVLAKDLLAKRMRENKP